MPPARSAPHDAVAALAEDVRDELAMDLLVVNHQTAMGVISTGAADGCVPASAPWRPVCREAEGRSGADLARPDVAARQLDEPG